MDLDCPVPKNQYDQILLAHGSGGKLTRELINSLIVPQLNNSLLHSLSDSSIIQIGSERIAFTTDGYVVSPLFFPGGSIGDLAVNGTINDLAVSGAKPIAISLSLIIEEGCDLKLVDQVVKAIAAASRKAKVPVATGDTKVVERGKCDKLYVVTSGIGLVKSDIKASSIQAGDVILCNGSIGDHGIAVMAAREGLEFMTPPLSDTAPLYDLINQLADLPIHFMRDATRGGVASVMNEIADDCGYDLQINESSLVIHEQVMAACELLGLDPLHIANEGKALIFLPREYAEKALTILRKHAFGKEAAIIGEVRETRGKRVVMKTRIGSERLVHMLAGEQLPRIC